MVIDMKTFFIIENGTVVNAIEWDGESQWSPPSGSEAVARPEGSEAWIGWMYDGSEFTNPNSTN